MKVDKAGAWTFASLLSIILLAILVCFSALVGEIDHTYLTEENSTLSINSSYYIDKIDEDSTTRVEKVLAEEAFITSDFDSIPYALADQSYWIKLTLGHSNKSLTQQPSASDLSAEAAIESNSSPLSSVPEEIVLMAEHSTLVVFEVYKLRGDQQKPEVMFDSEERVKQVSQLVYPHTYLQLKPRGRSEYLIHVKASGPPNIPLLLFEQQAFEKRLLLSQIIYGSFIGIFLVMAIYNLVLFTAAADKVYLWYIFYLLSSFVVLSTVTGYGYFLFPAGVAAWLNQNLLLFDFLLNASLLLFTLYFLKYDQSKTRAYSYALFLSIVLFAMAFICPWLDQISQTKLFFAVQPLFYGSCLYLMFHRIRKDFSWARFYFISWIPLIIGSVVQSMVALGQLESSFLARNSFLFAVMSEATFMGFALAERIRRNEKEKRNLIAYHMSNKLPRKNNLDNTVMDALSKGRKELTVAVIRSEQFKQIEQYIDEQTSNTFFQQLNDRLSTLFSNSKAVLVITERDEKVCFLENKSLAIVIDNALNDDGIPKLVQSIQQAVGEVFYINELKLQLSAGIGLANYPEHGVSSQALVENAIIAANAAEQSLEKWVYYSNSPHHDSSSIRLAAEIQKAILSDEFRLYHQPQIDLQTNKVYGSECLVRWQHPELGILGPYAFISIAEDFGLMPALTQWVIKTALQQQAGLCQKTGFDHMVSVNISGKDLIEEHFISDVKKLLIDQKINVEKVIFELTESLSFSENKVATETIKQLIELGITISIDDFGTGYSSMSQISKLPFHELKVDREFVENVCDCVKRKVIAETTVRMAKGLSLSVVAEGINSKLDETTLRDFGSDIGQGYYYAKPMAFDDYCNWLIGLKNGEIPEKEVC